MPTAVAVAARQQIARPLKVLVPLIQGELHQGNDAGREHYRRAGEMLIEAKDQVAYGKWGSWLTKNFDLSRTTAYTYMQWARANKPSEAPAGLRVSEQISQQGQMSGPAGQTTKQSPPFASLREMRGATERDRERRQSKPEQNFRKVLRDVAADTFVQERQERKDELVLHRELAAELVELGYRALATRLHPDRGGSKEAMARLNRVRDELRTVAATRRFV